MVKWLLILATVVALIYLFLGSRVQDVIQTAAGGKDYGKPKSGNSVLVSSGVQPSSTVGVVTSVGAISQTAPQMSLFIVPSPVITSPQKPNSQNFQPVS